MRSVKMNRGDPDRAPFLSNLVKGDVTVDNPDGVFVGGDTMGPYAEGFSGGIRSYGARSGTAKTITVK